MKTVLTQLLQIDYPIIQAPIGSATSPELAAAVSNAGGLGTLALSWKDPELTREFIRRTKKLTNKPFAVNLVLDFEQEERIQICIEEKAPVVSFFWATHQHLFLD
jgi:nitronate monooxygenase